MSTNLSCNEGKNGKLSYYYFDSHSNALLNYVYKSTISVLYTKKHVLKKIFHVVVTFIIHSQCLNTLWQKVLIYYILSTLQYTILTIIFYCIYSLSTVYIQFFLSTTFTLQIIKSEIQIEKNEKSV